MFQHLLLHDVIATLITLAFALLMDAIALKVG
jgi:hypothetical protein